MNTPTTTLTRPARHGSRGVVQRHPVATFFLLAFGLSWLAWTPFVLSESGLGVLDLRMPVVLGTDQLVGMLPGAYLGPLSAAFVVTLAADGREGLRRWGRRLVRWRVGWRWYVAVLTGVPAAVLLATLALPGAAGNVRMPGLVVLVAYLPMLLMQFVTTAAAEEPGWRDFALPRLQQRYGPAAGTVVLGLLWGCWHLPLFLTGWGGWPDLSWVEPVEFVVACVPLSLVMTWVFNRTGESLPLVMVLHASVNSVYTLVWPEVFPALSLTRDTLHAQLVATTAVSVVLLVATRGRLGLRVAEAPAARPDEVLRAVMPDGAGARHPAQQ
jgi:membrane protease YdiL (CAAX protease family)